MTTTHQLFLAISALSSLSLAHADDAATTDPAPQVVEIAGQRADGAGYAARNTASTKSELSLLETPQSISVLTRDLLDARAVTTLNEALQTSAGVTSGNWGRRGWDDFIIRGQRASESLYIDSLKRGQNQWVGQDVFGAERIEILKGPASINFGMVQPGGLVNMVSKRPRADAFAEIGATYGSKDFKQLDFDLGRPLSDNGKTAVRINGMWSDQDDPLDYVYFKKRYIAPSLSLDLGPDTDFTLLSSYAEREYLRSQGAPLKGTLLPNKNGAFNRGQFTGEPGFGPYNSRQAAIGYSLTHRFGNGWKLAQNFRFQQFDMDGRFVSLGALAADEATQARSGSIQDVQGVNRALDTYVERAFDLGGQRHTVMAGLDLNGDQVRNGATSCRIPSLNLYAPVYYQPYTCNTTRNSQNTTTVSYAALYLRDQIALNEQLNLSLSARHDRSKNKLYNELTNRTTEQRNNATTGSAALLYRLTPHVSPYISYASSFLPVSGADFFGAQFKPEEGKQAEIGAKFEYDNGRITGAVALYDLKRKNVTTADPDPAHIAILPSAQVQTGEERTKGFEAELNADLRNGWDLQAALSLINGRVTEDNAGNLGKRLLNVPRQSASLSSRYRFRGGALHGLSAGAGVRYEAQKTGPAVSYTVPGYTAVDANLGYDAGRYRVTLTVKNLFDRDYYAGVLSNNVLPLGDPRTVMLRVVTSF
ncbi:TonB-dependent siderophore receptor [Duganella sp. sic0402]|uniref:TonB-dependent siderophore receptor n=1 Tax=Duganella sp. sic0402 TaxID=2854786 RepID=UPI001C48909F|nr:TonB-dependent siderophore receptor [Duganella sp. sic0402]MBV7535400.1 TonB-dependent siderophore receptor [Duganella sp. sic0402]